MQTHRSFRRLHLVALFLAALLCLAGGLLLGQGRSAAAAAVPLPAAMNGGETNGAARPLTACSSVTLTTSLASPQSPGVSITLTGAASGCSTPEYKFWENRAGLGPSGWTVLQDYSSAASATWNTTGLVTGVYYLEVDARQQGSSTDPEAYTDNWDYELATNPCTGVTLTTSLASPQAAGTSITLNGTSVTGCPSPQYKFWYNRAGAGPTGWVVLQDYSSASSAVWNTTGLVAATYYLEVDVRNTGSTTSYEALSDNWSYVLTAGSSTSAPGIVSLSTPANNATATGQTPTLTWSAPSNSNSSTTYSVTIWDPFVPPSGNKLGDYSAGTSTSFTVSSGTLAAGHSYDWNVSACNGTACSGYGTWFGFSTSATPGAPQQSSPSNGATGQSLTPTLAWSSVSGATDYKVSIWDPYAVPDGHLMGDIDAGMSTSVAVPAAEGLFYAQDYYWNVTSCTGTSPSFSCSNYNSVWYRFTTAAMTTPAPGGMTFTPILTAYFGNGFAPAGWTAGGTNPATYTSATVGLDSNGSLLQLGFSLAMVDVGGGVYQGGSISLMAGSTLLFCAYNDYGQDFCPSGTRISSSDSYAPVIAVPSSVGSSASFTLTYTNNGAVVPGQLQRLGGLGAGNGPRIGVNASDRFPKPVGASVGGVDVATGALRITATDLSLGGAWPLSFTRGYNSEAPETLASHCRVALRWSCNWDGAVHYFTGGLSVQGPGGSFTFTVNGGGGYSAQQGVTASFVNGVLTTADQTRYTFPSTFDGPLQSVADRIGNTYTLAYDGQGRLSGVTAPSGRSITLHYTGYYLSSVSDSASRTVSYTHDSAGNLATVTDVRGNVWTYSYTSSNRPSQLQDPTSASGAYPHGNLPLRVTYDSQLRVASLEDGTDATISYAYGTARDGSAAAGARLGVRLRREPRRHGGAGPVQPGGRALL